MTGSWHVYPRGERWQRPPWQARVVLEAGDRVAVCFNAPVVELMSDLDEPLHPSLRGLGPDLLAEQLDVEEVRRHVHALPADAEIGQVLLDQRFVAGVGNIHRCESLFRCGVNPWATVGELGDEDVVRVVAAAASSLRAGVERHGRPMNVYRRTNRPCPRCATAVRSRPQGDRPAPRIGVPTASPARCARQPSRSRPPASAARGPRRHGRPEPVRRASPVRCSQHPRPEGAEESQQCIHGRHRTIAM